MAVHMQTGQGIDVVYDWEGERRMLLGVQRHGGELYPLTDEQAQGIAEGLLLILKENKEINSREPAKCT